MSAPVDLDPYALGDCYERRSGRVFLTGTQAIVRIVLDQSRRDQAQGLRTAGFVSGYRGSPLGGVDKELWRAKSLLVEHAIEFLPAVNEDLAATAVLGTQQVETQPRRTVDGVFGLWYGKGPGVDRAGDALKHGNAYGSSPHGGVLVVAGDDHGCVSSSMPHQSDVAFMSCFMPTLTSQSASRLATVTRNELREGLELLLEKVSGGAVFELSGLVVELSRASANEDFRSVEREGIEEDHGAAQLVLHATAGRADQARPIGSRSACRQRAGSEGATPSRWHS